MFGNSEVVHCYFFFLLVVVLCFGWVFVVVAKCINDKRLKLRLFGDHDKESLRIDSVDHCNYHSIASE